MPDAVDLVFAAVVFVGGASLDYLVLWPYLLRRVAAGDAGARVRVYRITMAGEWLLTMFVAVRWWVLARPWSALWLLSPGGWRLFAATLAVLAVAALWHMQNRAVARLSAKKRAALLSRSKNLVPLIPHTAREHRWFIALSVTAGICEELLYRGFLVWALQSRLGLAWAAAISVVVFGAAHAYQGKDVVRPIAVGAVLQGILLLTGSILPGMVIHAMLDVMSGTSGYLLVRESGPAVRSASSSDEGRG